MNTPRKFTPEYRQEAARLVLDTDRTISAGAEELGVAAGLRGRWVKAERERTGEGAEPSGEISANERPRTYPTTQRSR